jgi:ubiquinone/menaquinone biosynthesis C-methylase UbiE
MNSEESNLTYRIISRFYDLFDLIFVLGGKGNPRSGLVDNITGKDQRLLEICVGTASNSIVIAEKWRNVSIIGIDISPDMLVKAKEKIQNHNISNIQLFEMSADNIKFEDGYFDAVIISFALHEMEEELRSKIYKEVSRVIKPKGRFIIVDFAYQNNKWNHFFLNVWKNIEPKAFVPFLQTDWKKELIDYHMELFSAKEYSFSNVYTFQRK